jgi:hypothetical protein
MVKPGMTVMHGKQNDPLDEWCDYVFGDEALESAKDLPKRESSVRLGIAVGPRPSVAKRYVEGCALICIHYVLQAVGGRQVRKGRASVGEHCAVFGVEAASEWPPCPGLEPVVGGLGDVGRNYVRESGGVQGAVLIRVPEGLQQPERVVAVPCFVRLRPVNDCMRLWPETIELLRERPSDLRVFVRVVEEDRELDPPWRLGAGGVGGEVPGEVIKRGTKVVNSVSDNRPPDFIRRERGNVEENFVMPGVGILPFLAGDSVGVLCEVGADEVIEDVEVFLRPVELGLDAVSALHIGEQERGVVVGTACERPVVRVTPGAFPTRRFRFDDLD